MHPIFARLNVSLEKAKRELGNIEDAIRLFDNLGPEFADSWARITAVSAGVENAYTGLESILKSIAREIDGYVPHDEHWHQSLLTQMSVPIEGVRDRMLSKDTFELLSELRAFRNVVRNRYGLELKPGPVMENLQRLRQVLPRFESDFRRLVKAMSDGPTPDKGESDEGTSSS